MADDPITTTTPPVVAPAAPALTLADPAATVPPATPDPSADEPLREPGKKALDAERTARQKAENDLAALRKEVEDSKKTAEQKAADDLKAAQAEAAANAAKALSYEVAAETDLPLALAPRLRGTTREELLADAEALKALMPTADATPATTPRPAPDPGQGPRPQTQKTQEDLDYEALFGPST